MSVCVRGVVPTPEPTGASRFPARPLQCQGWGPHGPSAAPLPESSVVLWTRAGGRCRRAFSWPPCHHPTLARSTGASTPLSLLALMSWTKGPKGALPEEEENEENTDGIKIVQGTFLIVDNWCQAGPPTSLQPYLFHFHLGLCLVHLSVTWTQTEADIVPGQVSLM